MCLRRLTAVLFDGCIWLALLIVVLGSLPELHIGARAPKDDHGRRTES